MDAHKSFSRVGRIRGKRAVGCDNEHAAMTQCFHAKTRQPRPELLFTPHHLLREA
jgi:hypothetical protein